MAENCLYNAAAQQGGVLHEEYRDAVEAGATHILAGATDFAAFAKAMRADMGRRFDPYLDALWRDSKDEYTNQYAPAMGANAPVIKVTAADYLPDYAALSNYSPAQVQTSLIEAATRLAAENKVDIARGVAHRTAAGEKPTKPWADTEAEAKALGLDDSAIHTLRSSGLPLDVVTAAIAKLQGEAHARAHDAAEYARNNPQDNEAKLRFIEASKMADMWTLEHVRNATETGRALNFLKQVTNAFKGKSDTALAFERMFGTKGVQSKLPLPENAEQIATSAPAPASGRGEPLKVPTNGDVTAAAARKKKNPKPPAPMVRGTQVVQNPFSMEDTRAGQGAPVPRMQTVVEKARVAAATRESVASATRGVGEATAPPTPTVSRAVETRVRSISRVIAETPHLQSKLAQARETLKQANVKGMASAGSGVPLLNQLHIDAAKLYAEAYFEAGVTSFNEFRYAVRAHVGIGSDELPDDALTHGWQAAGGSVGKSGHPGAPRNTPAHTPALLDTVGTVESHRTAVEKMGAQAQALAPVTGGGEADLGMGAHTVADLASRDAARPPAPRVGGNETSLDMARHTVEDLAGRDNAKPPPPRVNAGGEAEFPSMARHSVEDLAARDSAAPPSPRVNAGGEAPVGGKLPIQDTTVTARRAATDRLSTQDTPQERAGGAEADFTGIKRDLVDGLLKRAQEQKDNPIVKMGGDEAGSFGQRAGESAQTVMPDAGQSAGGTLPELFKGERAEAVRKRLADAYEAPSTGRDKKIPAMLTEVGGYLYQQGVKDFPEWCARMNGAAGKRIAAADLMNAYQEIRPESLKRVRGVTDLRQAAIKRAAAFANTEQTNAAIDAFAAVDPKSPDAAKQYSDILNEYRKYTPIDYFKEVFGLQRAVETSFDISAPFRQGLVLTLSRPKQSIPAMRDMLRAFSDKDFGDSVMNEIHSRPNSDLYETSGLPMSALGGDTIDLTQREEAKMTGMVGHIASQKYSDPQTLASNFGTRFLFKGIEASERAYVVYLNRLRADVFDSIIADYMKQGYTPEVYPELYRATAAWIGDATGRSRLPKVFGQDLEDNARLLSNTFFSARFQWSRVKVLSGPVRASLPENWYGGVPAPLRKQMWRDMAGAAVGITSMLGLLHLMGASVDLDWRSSDFLKARFGDTRVDVMGGLQQWIRLAGQMITGEKVNAKGHVIPLDGKGVHGDRGEIIKRFVQSKEAPAITTAMKMYTGQDYVGNPVYRGTPAQVAGDLGKEALPLWIPDMYEGFQHEGAKGALLTLLQLVGIGVATYDNKPPQKRR